MVLLRLESRFLHRRQQICDQLGGTFFFHRRGIEEDQTHFLFATLAYQLAYSILGLTRTNQSNHVSRPHFTDQIDGYLVPVPDR